MFGRRIRPGTLTIAKDNVELHTRKGGGLAALARLQAWMLSPRLETLRTRVGRIGSRTVARDEGRQGTRRVNAYCTTERELRSALALLSGGDGGGQ